MPNRYLRESYLGSVMVNDLGWQGEVFWTRLLVSVDDWGRCEANPKLLRAKLFPLRLDAVREADVSRLIAECEKAGLVRLYSCDGKEYLQMFKWEIGRAENSKCPDPPPEIITACYLQTSVRRRKQVPTDAGRCPDSDPDPDNDPDAVDDSARDNRSESPTVMPSMEAWLKRRLPLDEWEKEWWAIKWRYAAQVNWVDVKGREIRNWHVYQDGLENYFRNDRVERKPHSGNGNNST